jgi:hypothetical protein
MLNKNTFRVAQSGNRKWKSPLVVARRAWNAKFAPKNRQREREHDRASGIADVRRIVDRIATRRRYVSSQTKNGTRPVPATIADNRLAYGKLLEYRLGAQTQEQH